MPNKYLSIVSGVQTEKEASASSAGAGDAGKIVALDTNGLIDNSMLPVGVGYETEVITASENLSAGNIVNVYTDSGASKARKADATTAGKEATGFVLASVTSGNPATVYVEQKITGLTGLTPGAMYWLSTTAGAATATAPSGSGNVNQRIGRALSATVLAFQPGEPTTLA